MEKRNCLFCCQPLQGRNDKKFCDDHCRSAFNNRTNSEFNKQMRQVNAVLKRNRKILEQIYTEQKANLDTVYKRKIQELGFVFNFHTHIEELEEGKTCVCCYEYGYFQLNPQELAIVKLR